MASLSSCINQLPYLLPSVIVGTKYYPLLLFCPPISKAELNMFIFYCTVCCFCFTLLATLVILSLKLELYPHSSLPSLQGLLRYTFIDLSLISDGPQIQQSLFP